MKYALRYTSRFKKSLKRCVKRGLDLQNLREVINLLQEGGELSNKHHPPRLSGMYSQAWECHIQPDWLLIWTKDEEELVLLLLDTGSHSDIF